MNVLRQKSEEKIFRVYVTDSIKAIARNTAPIAGKDGLLLNQRYIEIIDDQKPEEEPKESAEQIKSRIAAGLNAIAATQEKRTV